MTTPTPPIDDSAINKLLSKARIALMAQPASVFFTTILMSLKFQWDDTQPTAWVDGYRMGFNRDFFMKCTLDQRIFVLVHECCHIAYLHTGTARKGTRIHELWIRACDHVINLDLEAKGFKMFDWVLKDQRFRGMSTEQVYDVLHQEWEDQGKPTMPQIEMDDLRLPPEAKDEKEYKRHVDDILVRAMVQAKITPGAGAGNIPGDVLFYLEDLLNPKLTWQNVLRKYLTALGKNGFTWKKPNRRFYPGHYLPSRWSSGNLENFMAWVDISGSETDDDFQRFVSELAGIFRMMKPEKITLGQFDHVIKSIDVVKGIEDLKKIKFTGRGGTNITNVLNEIERAQPKLAMIWSDGEFYMDRQKLACKTDIIWMIHDDENWTAPFGKVIHFNTYG